MRLRCVLLALLLLPACGSSSAAGTGTSLDDRGATVYAEGLTSVASLAFNDEGDLFAGTASYEADGTDGVYVIGESGDEPVEVIDGQNTVLGLLWFEDELYVASAERIDAYGGYDGTTFATTRTVAELPSGVGEVNGLAVDDGTLVVGISAPCDDCDPELDESGAVLSVGTDGSNLTILASGIRAPIGLAYRPGTNDLYVTMNQRDDLGDDTPGDWLSMVTEGQDWGFPDGDSPDPVAELDQHAAVSGLAFLDESTALVSEWATGTVKTVDVDSGEVSDWLTGVENPVAIVVDGDGDVLVGDWSTGTIYEV